MFRHVVLLKYRADATAEQKDAVLDGLAGLPAAIPVIRSYLYGPDAGVEEGNYDLALVADFDSRADFLAYQQHPTHVDFMTRYGRPVTESRVAVQHEW